MRRQWPGRAAGLRRPADGDLPVRPGAPEPNENASHRRPEPATMPPDPSARPKTGAAGADGAAGAAGRRQLLRRAVAWP